MTVRWDNSYLISTQVVIISGGGRGGCEQVNVSVDGHVGDVDDPANSIRHIEPLDFTGHILVIVAADRYVGVLRILVDALERVGVAGNQALLVSFVNETPICIWIKGLRAETNNGGDIIELFKGWTPLSFVRVIAGIILLGSQYKAMIVQTDSDVDVAATQAPLVGILGACEAHAQTIERLCAL